MSELIESTMKIKLNIIPLSDEFLKFFCCLPPGFPRGISSPSWNLDDNKRRDCPGNPNFEAPAKLERAEAPAPLGGWKIFRSKGGPAVGRMVFSFQGGLCVIFIVWKILGGIMVFFPNIKPKEKARNFWRNCKLGSLQRKKASLWMIEENKLLK